jgi:long-subunit fatty acid transport protein
MGLSRIISRAVIASSIATLIPLHAFGGGGISRDGQDVSFMYDNGKFLSISLKQVTPKITGSSYTPLGAPAAIATSASPEYSTYSVNYRQDAGEKTGLGFQIRTPIGGDLAYPAGSVLQGTSIDYNSQAVSILGSYDQSRELRFIGGFTSQSQDATVSVPFQGYEAAASKASGMGFIAGASYSIPEIAFRVSGTYFSSIGTEHPTTETTAATGIFPSTTSITAPSGFNFDIRSGIMEDTIAYASVVSQNWDEFVLAPPVWAMGADGDPLYDPESKTVYMIGIGRKFSDTWAGSISYGLSEETDGTASALAPVDGSQDISVGIRYTMDAIELGLGATVRTYTNDVSATQELAPGLPIATYTDNSTTGIGLSMKYSY